MTAVAEQTAVLIEGGIVRRLAGGDPVGDWRLPACRGVCRAERAGADCLRHHPVGACTVAVGKSGALPDLRTFPPATTRRDSPPAPGKPAINAGPVLTSVLYVAQYSVRAVLISRPHRPPAPRCRGQADGFVSLDGSYI